jgi:hypothetical protein
VYRHNGSWKLRALGFNGGLEPLAMSYGVDVAAASTTCSYQSGKETRNKSPRLVSLAKKASVSLTKNKLETLRQQLRLFLTRPAQ